MAHLELVDKALKNENTHKTHEKQQKKRKKTHAHNILKGFLFS
jgi:hypothetical protein